MEFSAAEIIAILAVILNVIVFLSRVPSKKDFADLRLEMNERFLRLNERIDRHLENHP